MTLPTMPGTHTWVQGGPMLAKAGRAALYGADGAQVYVWDEQTGLQVTDLRDVNGAIVSSVPIVDGWVDGVGVPVTTLLASFSVGQYGKRFFATPVQSLLNAANASAPANVAIDNRMKWQPSTAYALGQQVISPNGDVVKANVAHTSSAAYATDVAKWTLPTTTVVFDTSYATLEDALTACPTGGVLEVRGTWSRVLPFSVSKACTIRFTRGGSISSTVASANGINVSANGVTIENPTLTGTGSGSVNSGCGIYASGTAGSPVDRLTIRGKGAITAWARSGVSVENATNLTVEDVDISNIAYCGIEMLSVIGFSIQKNRVSNIVQPSGYVNSYGIAASRDSTKTLANGPRSANGNIDKNTVSGVANWEGIDTHAGTSILISGNTVTGCNFGIVATSGKDTGGTDTYAPTGIIITGNTISSGVTDGSRSNGVLLNGSATEMATGIISANTVTDHGLESSTGTTANGAICIFNTQGAVITGNTIVRPTVCGVQVYTNNAGVVIANNQLEDFWSNSFGGSGAVYVRSNTNTLVVSGTRITRGAKSATKVNDRGYWIASGSLTGIVAADGGGNQWEACANPVIDAGNFVEFRNHAKKLGFYGVTPVVRAAAITTPNTQTAAYVQADVASLKTAIDAIRVALQNVGITS